MHPDGEWFQFHVLQGRAIIRCILWVFSLILSLSLVTAQVSFPWQQIWGQALSHETAVLLPPFIQVHSRCWQIIFLSLFSFGRCWRALLIFLFTFIPEPVLLWLCLSPCLFPGSLFWSFVQSGYTLCPLTVIIYKEKWPLPSCTRHLSSSTVCMAFLEH